MRINFRVLAVLLAAGSIGYAQKSGDAIGARAQNNTGLSIASVTDQLKKYEGFFDFYYDEKTGKIFLEIDKMDQEFLYFSSLSTGVGNGGPERGQASSAIAKFVKAGPKVLLIQPVSNYRAITDNKDEIKAVDNAFAKSVIWVSFP